MTVAVANRLYVGNLAEDTSAAALRRRFEQCGNVVDVQLAFDRGSGRMRGFAFVTMADAVSMKSALSQLNGQLFEDRPLRVSESNDTTEDGQSNYGSGNGGRSKPKDVPLRAKVTSQFRERTCMAYELDCTGVRVSFKMYPTSTGTGTEDWRVDAWTSLAPETIVSESAPDRKAAFHKLESTWVASGAAPLDWRAIEEALATVRGLS